ncbi:MAG: tetratricopeptide repeat protein [Hyphomicrobium sp.]
MAQAVQQFLFFYKLKMKISFLLLLSSCLLVILGIQTFAQPHSAPHFNPSATASDLTTEKHADTAASNLLDGKLNEALTSYTNALKDQKLTNDNRASLLNDRAVAYTRMGEFKSALEDFNAAVQLYPEFAPIYNNRGILLISLEHYKEALKDFNRAIFLSPKYAAAFNNRGAVYLQLGQKGLGLDDFNNAIELAPEAPELLNSRGRSHLNLKRPLSSIRDFTHAVGLDNRFSLAYKNRAQAKMILAAYSEAIEDYSRAIAFNSNDPELFCLRGEAFFNTRDFPSALEDYNRALSLNPKYELAYVGRGLAKSFLGKYEEGISDLDVAMNLNSQSALAYAYRGLVRIKIGQIDLSKDDIETAFKYDKKQAEVLWAKATLEEQLGQLDQALLDLRQALELKPWIREATDMQQRLSPGGIDLPIDTFENSNSEGWRLIRRNGQILALNQTYPQLIVPLDMVDESSPKILLWEIKQGPFEGYGILKYAAGSLLTSRGSEECEMSIFLDLANQRIVGILPERQGNKTSTWKWEDNSVIVEAIDGLRDEFTILKEAPRVGPVASSSPSVSRRTSTQNYSPDWAPWNQPLGMPDEGINRKRRTNNSVQKSKGSKSFFDYFFN